MDRSDPHLCIVAILLALIAPLGLLSCTQGAITDAVTEAPIGDVEVSFDRWPPPESRSYSWEWPRHFRRHTPDHRTRSTPFFWRGANYGFGGSGECSQAPEEIVIPHSWYRITLRREGYHPGIFYRYHGGYEEICSFMPCSPGLPQDGPCNVQDFQLQPLGATFPLLPDLIVDPREFLDRSWQCALVPDGDPLLGLRIAVGTVNIGEGALHLIGEDTTTPEESFVSQRVDFSDGTSQLFALPPGSFEFHPGHNHIHFRNWVVLNALADTETCRSPEDRSQDCQVATSGKISFCIMDLEPFDADIRAEFGGEIPLYPDPPTCDSLLQGLSPGWKDVYHSELEGQVIIFGPLHQDSSFPSSVWIEAHVDPLNLLQQRSRENSIAGISLSLPEDPITLCNDPERTIDCRGNLHAMDFQRRMQCPDYLNH